MSPPSLGNGSKENEGCLQFHFDLYNVQNGRGSRMGNHAHATLSNSPFNGLVMTSEHPPYGMVPILISFPMSLYDCFYTALNEALKKEDERLKIAAGEVMTHAGEKLKKSAKKGQRLLRVHCAVMERREFLIKYNG